MKYGKEEGKQKFDVEDDIRLRKPIIQYLQKDIQERKNILRCLRHSTRLTDVIFPYCFVRKYKLQNVVVYEDDSCGLLYVLQEGKRMYFPAAWSRGAVVKYYNGLLIEQDAQSPHRYEYGSFRVEQGDVVVDVGTAEGNFALLVAERARKLYLFEGDVSWLEPLRKTFEPWHEKVTIVNKYHAACVKNVCVKRPEGGK